MKNWREVTNCILYPMRGKSDWQGRTDIGAPIALVLKEFRRIDAIRPGEEGGDA